MSLLKTILLWAVVFISSLGIREAISQELNLEQERGDLRYLTPHEFVEQELTGSETHSFSIRLVSGQFLRADLYSPNLSLGVSITGPNGQDFFALRSRRGVPTAVCLVASISGNYRLGVSSEKEGPPTGRYQLRVSMLRMATVQDLKQVVASRALNEADQMRSQWTFDSFRKAIDKYQQALLGWRVVGDPAQQASALENIGDLHELLSEHEKALTAYGKALVLYREMKDRKAESRTLSAMGVVYVEKGENHGALEACDHALQRSRAMDDSWGEAGALYCMGLVHYSFSDTPKALEFLNQALDLRRSVHDRSGEAETLRVMGYSHHGLKETQKAHDLYQQSLRISQEVGDLQGQARALLSLGHLLNMQGERQKALGSYHESSGLFQRMGDRTGESSAIQGIAVVYSAMGEKEKGLDYFRQALSMFRQLRDAEGEASALRYLGEVHRELGNYDDSLQCSQQAIQVYRTMSSVLGESYAMCDIGKVYEAQGKSEKALECYTKALELCRKGGEPFHEGFLLNAIGHVYQLKGQHAMALDYYQRALALQREVKDSVGEPGTLYNIARFEADRSNFNAARAHVEAALRIVESLRTKVASQDLRSSYFASVRQHYDLYVDLLMRMHQERPSEGLDAAALQASERGRARSLLESLTEARADIRQGIDPTLLERERSLQRLLNTKADRQMRLLSARPDKEEVDAVAKELRDLRTEYEQVEGEIRSKSPRYAALMQPQPLGLQEIQQQVLDDESLLLEYALGDDNSYLWAVTKTGVSSHRLPKRAEIEKLAQQVYEALIARQPKLEDTPKQYRLRVEQAEVQYRERADALSQMVLSPVADQLTNRRLLIVAEGALQYVQFGALPKPEKWRRGDTETRGHDESPTPLIVDHEIVNLPSASVMAVLRRQIEERQPASKMIAVLADPVFEPDDPRLVNESGTRRDGETAKKQSTSLRVSPTRRKASESGTPSSQLSRPASDLQRALRDAGISRDGLSVPRLLSTRQEAEAILSVAPTGMGLKALDFEASRATATSPELGQYRIVHFATHGLLNSEHPELSGLVLSLVDEQGKGQDGFLRLHDIYNLNLPADLVVLSACNTGLGKDVRGEGLVGIVRGFMYAGAARVVASLWKVDDEATAELMKRFYRYMLQENMPAAAALKAAQVEMRQQKRWHSPYYWAGFTLQGEWR